jgi:SAM-dependent methyltransferase
VDLEDYRLTSRQTWEAMAPGWERWRAQLTEALSPVRAWLIGELAPRAGDTVLELGASVGDTGFEAAAGPAGRLISSDFSQEMVDVARRRGAELGLRNVDYRVIDAERIELDADSVDGVLCQSTYMLVADPAAALAETRRVLRPGGRLALSVWGAPERNPWAVAGRVPRGAGSPAVTCAGGARDLQHGERSAHARTARPGGLHRRAHGGGADALRVRRSRRLREMGAGGGGRLDDGGPEVVRGRAHALRAELAEGFTPFATESGYDIPGVALCAVAS